MSTVERSIYGTKKGIIAELKERWAQEMTGWRNEKLTRYTRHQHLGYAEGLEYAMAMLEDWKGEEEPEAPGDDLATRMATLHQALRRMEFPEVTDPEAWDLYISWFNTTERASSMTVTQARMSIAEYLDRRFGKRSP